MLEVTCAFIGVYEDCDAFHVSMDMHGTHNCCFNARWCGSKSYDMPTLIGRHSQWTIVTDMGHFFVRFCQQFHFVTPSCRLKTGCLISPSIIVPTCVSCNSMSFYLLLVHILKRSKRERQCHVTS